jgi:hypothetical protein
MAGNLVSTDPHSTFIKKVSNFPDNLYSFDDNNNITTLMKILLGNSGTGQLRNIQTVARLTQEHIEFSNLDSILGEILNISRVSSEIYSFSTNPFIDQLTSDQWDEVDSKDSKYRERLLGAAEAFQTGATVWSIMTLCQAMTGIKFYVTESWRTPGLGRPSVDSKREVVLIPILDSTQTVFQWDQSKAQTIVNAIKKIIGINLVVSFGQPLLNLVNANATTASGSDTSEYFLMQPTVISSKLSTPANIQTGGQTRYWLTPGQPSVAPFFAHLQSQEVSIDVTGNIINVSSTDNSGVPYNSVASPSVQVTSTVYGAQ